MYLLSSRRPTANARRLWLAGATLGLATGCTIIAPVQTPQADRRFPVSSAADRGTAPCKPHNPDLPGECAPLEVDIDAFHGGLGRALWETDVRRRELIAQAAQHTNINASYNALLWPLGAYFIRKKIRHPEWSALDVAAVATASYGFLSSGIPDRDQLYVRTAARMACSITLFDADLYMRKEIKPKGYISNVDDPDWQPAVRAGYTFVELVDQLGREINEFAAERDNVLVNLKLRKQKVGPTGRSGAEKLRLEAMGLAGKPKAQSDPSKEFAFETETLLARARDQLSTALRLRQQLDDAGPRLRRQRIAIEAALTQGLNERTPALQQPTAVAAQIAQAFEAGMASERKFSERVSERASKESGTSRSEDWLPTQALLADLDEDSRICMTTFWAGERVALKRAMAKLAEWTARHDERLRLAKADAASMGCSEGDLAEFTRSLSKAAEGAGSSAPTPPKASTTK